VRKKRHVASVRGLLRCLALAGVMPNRQAKDGQDERFSSRWISYRRSGPRARQFQDAGASRRSGLRVSQALDIRTVLTSPGLVNFRLARPWPAPQCAHPTATGLPFQKSP
jgi:hypothetical protein